jgi:hypothetical protein
MDMFHGISKDDANVAYLVIQEKRGFFTEMFLRDTFHEIRDTREVVRNPIIVVRFSVEGGALLVQPLGGEVALGIECRHTTHARGGNGLAIDVVDAVPGSEDTGHAGLSAIFGKDVTLFIGLDLV